MGVQRFKLTAEYNELPAGTIVYTYLGGTKTDAAQKTNATGNQHIAVTLDANGKGRPMTLTLWRLDQLSDEAAG